MAVSSLFLTIDHFPIEGEYAPSSGWLRQDRRIFGLARIVRARLAYGRPACYRRRSAAGLWKTNPLVELLRWHRAHAKDRQRGRSRPGPRPDFVLQFCI